MLGWLTKTLDAVAEDRRQGFDAAKRTKTDGWNPFATSINSEIIGSLPKLWAKSRDLIQNNSLAASSALKLTNGAVGWGIHPFANTAVDDFNELVDRRHEEWAANCHPRELTEAGIQCQAVLGMMASGEAWVVGMEAPPDAKMRVPLWFDIYEADMVDHEMNVATKSGKTIIQGVEVDQYKRVVAYHFHKAHPGDSFNWGQIADGSHIRMPAERVIHLAEKCKFRPSQYRGIPRLTPVINDIRHLSDFQLTELVKQKVAACFGIIFTDTDETSEGKQGLCDANGRPITGLNPGMLGYAPKGASVTTVEPPTVVGYWDYIRGHQHGIGAGVGLPYATLSGDLSQVNFSSSRMGQGIYLRENDALQWLTVIPLLCARMWRMWITAAYDAGVLTVPVVPATYAVQRFPSVNPAQDAQARRYALRDGSTTLSDAIMEDGENPRAVFKKRAAENKILDGLGLVFDSDPRNRTLAGVEQPDYGQSNDGAGDQNSQNAGSQAGAVRNVPPRILR